MLLGIDQVVTLKLSAPHKYQIRRCADRIGWLKMSGQKRILSTVNFSFSAGNKRDVFMLADNFQKDIEIGLATTLFQFINLGVYDFHVKNVRF